MMELELKHLAAYLPYGLKVQSSIDNSVGLLFSLAGHQYQVKGKFNLNNGTDLREFVQVDFNNSINITNSKNFKPILRPLSDLVINEDVIEDFIGLGNWCIAYDEYLEHWYPDSSYAKQAHYVIFEYFLENHFDVFGLIPKGLAIDINTLKK